VKPLQTATALHTDKVAACEELSENAYIMTRLLRYEAAVTDVGSMARYMLSEPDERRFSA